MPPENKHSARWPRSDQRSLIQRAATLRAQARSAISPEARVDFERLAVQYQRMAARVAKRDLQRSTLADLLYGNKAADPIPETEWIALVNAVAARHQYAFQTLYLWTRPLVFSLIMRITNDWFATEEAALDVYYEVWQEAGRFDPFDDTVIGWIMNKARARALRADPVQIDSTAGPQIFEAIGDPSADSLAFSATFWARIAQRITAEINDIPLLRMIATERESDWEHPASHIYCKVLAKDTQRDRVSMLVRLAPGGEYPPHMHAGVEQLHLLEGELWIDTRKLLPGDYSCLEPGTADDCVWSATGCACVLITSSRDILS